MVGMNILNNPYKEKYSFITPSRSELNLLDLVELNNFFTENAQKIVITDLCHLMSKSNGLKTDIVEGSAFFAASGKMETKKKSPLRTIIVLCIKFNTKLPHQYHYY